MESANWTCGICDQVNQSNLTKCQMCDEERPKQQAPHLEQAKQSQQIPAPQKQINTRQPIQLFNNTKGSIDLVQGSLSQIRENFDQDKKIVVLVAAGLLGTGKSTWLSGLIYECEKYYYQTPGRFEVGHSVVTQTEGIWVYPHPLILPGCENTQIMLLDMEGTEGIKLDQDADTTKSSLMRLYTLGLMLASVFTIHTNFRIDNTTIETLKQSFMIVKQLMTEVPMQIPAIHILVKDCKEVNTGKKNIDPKSFITESCGLEDDLAALLNICGRPKPCEQFLLNLQDDAARNNAFDLLQGTELAEFNSNFLQGINSATKKIPCLDEDMTIENFASHLIELSKVINASNYQSLFKGSIEKMLIELIKPIKEDLLDLYRGRSNAIAANFPLDKEIDELQYEIQSLRERVISQFREEAKKVIKGDLDKFDLIKTEERQFNVLMKNNTAEQNFIFRKIEYGNAKDKSLLEARIQKMQEEAKGQEKALQTIEKNYKGKISSLESQVQQNNKDYEAKLQRLQEEYNRKLQLSMQKSKQEVEEAKKNQQKIQEEFNTLNSTLRQHGIIYKTKQQQAAEEALREAHRRRILESVFGLK